jgi:hypothetical protein
MGNEYEIPCSTSSDVQYLNKQYVHFSKCTNTLFDGDLWI